MPPRKKPRTGPYSFESDVWIYKEGLIVRVEETLSNGNRGMKASCKKCNTVWHSTDPRTFNSTSNYVRHYNKYHPEVDITGPQNEEDIQEATARAVSQTALKQTSISMFAQQNTPINPETVPISYKRKPNEPLDQDIFLKLLITFIVSCNLPLRICDSPYLKNLLQYLCSSVQRVTPQRLLNKMLTYYEESHKAMRKRLRLHIEHGARVGITFDIWTGSNGTSYLGVTVHWCDKDWVSHARLLGFLPMPTSHTGHHIFKGVKQVVQAFGIQHHIISFTTDSADPNRLACQLFEKWLKKNQVDDKEEGEKDVKPPVEEFSALKGWISCLAHAANRSVQDILGALRVGAPKSKDKEEVLYSQVTETTFSEDASEGHQNAMKKARRIIVKHRRSAPFRQVLEKQCLACDVKPLTLFLDMEVRWYSTSNMLDRFILLENPLKNTLANPPSELKDLKLSQLKLTDFEWEKLKELQQIFGIYQPVVEKLSGYSYPTLGDVLPTYVKLQSALHKEKAFHSVRNPVLATALQAGIDKLQKYLNKAQLGETAVIATILNPYFKLNKLQSLGWTNQELERDKKAFYKVFGLYQTVYGIPVPTEEEEYESDDEDPLNHIDEIAGTPEPETGRILNEAEQYLREHYLRRKVNGHNPTYKEFWQAREGVQYPILARMAKDYGVIMATSVPSESVFSIAGLILTKLRNRLAPKTMGVIMCLKSWGLLNDVLIEAAETEMGGLEEEEEDEDAFLKVDEKGYDLTVKGDIDVVLV